MSVAPLRNSSWSTAPASRRRMRDPDALVTMVAPVMVCPSMAPALILAAVTAPAAILSAVTALALIFSAVMALAAIAPAVMAPAAICVAVMQLAERESEPHACVTHAEPSHRLCTMAPPLESNQMSPVVGELGWVVPTVVVMPPIWRALKDTAPLPIVAVP